VDPSNTLPNALPSWRRSSRCLDPQRACVEFAEAGDRVYLRDSKTDDSPILEFDVETWRTFVAALKAGEFAAPATGDPSAPGTDGARSQ
jgi:hypothetical protein